MSRVIFASHGELSKGMKDSISMIFGDVAKDIETYSLLSGQNPEDYYRKLYVEAKNSDEQILILCDVKGGSVHTALSKLSVLKNVIVFSGMNMVLAMEIILKKSSQLTCEDSLKAVENAREGITMMNRINPVEIEDF